MTPSSSDFDIVSYYHALVKSNEAITPPIAAIESLIALLTSTPATTISETLSLLQDASALLHSSVRNPIPVTAGTDLFQRYVVTTLQRPGALGPGGDFNLLRNHLINNSRIFVARAKEARSKIAEHALPFIIKPNSHQAIVGTQKSTTIVTYGPSRVVFTLLQYGARKSVTRSPSFKVIYITPGSPPESLLSKQLESQISHLRSIGIPTATVPSQATAYALSTLSTAKTTTPFIVTGASAVLADGGILSHMGTYQLALLTQRLGHKFYVACESYKVVRKYLLAQKDALASAAEDVVHFEPSSTPSKVARRADQETQKQSEYGSEDSQAEALMDVTPPKLITALITENGVMTPNAVSEELVKLWF